MKGKIVTSSFELLLHCYRTQQGTFLTIYNAKISTRANVFKKLKLFEERGYISVSRENKDNYFQITHKGTKIAERFDKINKVLK